MQTKVRGSSQSCIYGLGANNAMKLSDLIAGVMVVVEDRRGFIQMVIWSITMTKCWQFDWSNLNSLYLKDRQM